MSDEIMHDLAARLARGEEAAFAELYDLCGDRLYRYLASRHGADEAADVLQTAFLRAVKSRRQFRKVENPVAYMFQIARNEAAQMAESGRRRCVQTELLDEAQPITESSNAAGDDAETIAVALSRLTYGERELVELKFYGGLTFREIAEIVGRPQATVATQYRRALESLRGWLTKQFR